MIVLESLAPRAEGISALRKTKLTTSISTSMNNAKSLAHLWDSMWILCCLLYQLQEQISAEL